MELKNFKLGDSYKAVSITGESRIDSWNVILDSYEEYIKTQDLSCLEDIVHLIENNDFSFKVLESPDFSTFSGQVEGIEIIHNDMAIIVPILLVYSVVQLVGVYHELVK